jgi:hypothetical protein
MIGLLAWANRASSAHHWNTSCCPIECSRSPVREPPEDLLLRYQGQNPLDSVAL